jgi:DNA-binding NtrC family response regulator
LHLTEWARRLGINHTTLTERLEKWPLEKALTQPRRRW